MPIYYNLVLNNTTNSSIPLRFDQQLNIPFIQKPSDWDVSIIRFVLPNFENPIFTFIDGNYDISMSYNGHTVTQQIVYIPETTDTTYRGIFEIQHMILMLNSQIASLYTALNGIVTLPTTDMPFFEYNEGTGLISYVANKSYFASDLSLPIVISVSQTTFKFLQGLPVYSHQTYYDLLVRDTGNNELTTGYYTMTQQSPSFANYSDFNSVVLTTNLPIQNEFLGSATTLPIIQDYCPADLNITTYHNPIVYNAVVPYRQVSLVSDQSFYSIRFDCFISNTAGNLTPMTLPPNSSANIKLMFTKKAHNQYA